MEDALKKALDEKDDLTEIEVESRFDYYKLNLTQFNNIKNKIYKMPDLMGEIEIKSQDFIYFGNVRHTIIGDQTFIITKTQVLQGNRFKYEDSDFKYKITISKETKVEFKDKQKESPELIRIKSRTRFIFNKFFIDLTVVEQFKDDEYIVKYEIESEIQSENLRDADILSEFQSFIKSKIIPLVQDTKIIYTEKNKKDTIKNFNRLFGSEYENKNSLNYKFLVKARNLKMRDCKYGGLIGNSTKYVIMPKIDGIRKLLLIANNGIWLVYPPFELNWITKSLSNKIDGWDNIINTIIDGEYIESENKFIMFDIVYFNGRHSENTFTERYKQCEIIFDIFKLIPGLDLKLKTELIQYEEIGDTANSLFQSFNKLEQKITVKTDGFIFRPENTKYNPESDKISLDKRILSKYPDMCKLKSWEELTIDVRIKNNRAYVSGNEGDILFHEIGEIDYLDDLKVQSGDVVEIAPKYVITASDKILKFYAKKIRIDKLNPNRIEIAQDIYDDIMNPLDFDIFRGNTEKLLKQYHDEIKENLLKTHKNSQQFFMGINSVDKIDIKKNLCLIYFQECENYKNIYTQITQIYSKPINFIYLTNNRELLDFFEITDYEIANQELFLSDKDLSKIFYYGNKQINIETYESDSDGEIDETEDSLENLVVNIDLDTPFALGDDYMVPLVDNYYRIATIHENSLYHSILKIMSDEYNLLNKDEKIKKAGKLKNKYENINVLVNKLKINIIIYKFKDGQLKILQKIMCENKPEKRLNIELLKIIKHDHYEPLYLKN